MFNSNSPIEFWKRQDYPNSPISAWVKFARKLILIQPSTASVERVWSIFSNFFDHSDIKTTQMDYMDVVLLAQYNHLSDTDDSVVTMITEELQLLA